MHQLYILSNGAPTIGQHTIVSALYELWEVSMFRREHRLWRWSPVAADLTDHLAVYTRRSDHAGTVIWNRKPRWANQLIDAAAIAEKREALSVAFKERD